MRSRKKICEPFWDCFCYVSIVFLNRKGQEKGKLVLYELSKVTTTITWITGDRHKELISKHSKKYFVVVATNTRILTILNIFLIIYKQTTISDIFTQCNQVSTFANLCCHCEVACGCTDTDNISNCKITRADLNLP